MKTTFTGFRRRGWDLLIENRLRNDKAFYEAHKDAIRRDVIEPFYALCACMTPAMQEIDPLFVTVPSRMVSRVRRDTRYTKDKTLYRANMWLFFRRPRAERESVPFYYMEVSPDYWSYGCFGGYGQGEMAIAREMILAEDRLFLDAFRAAGRVQAFTLEGDLYKRPRFPDAPEAYQPWLNRKISACNLWSPRTSPRFGTVPLWDPCSNACAKSSRFTVFYAPCVNGRETEGTHELHRD